MDYEKKYYIALDKARLLHHNLVKYGVKIITKDIEDIFPELKESENKRMIQYFKDLAPFDKADELYEKYGFSHKDAIDWLEKQKGTEREIEGNSLCNGEQKPVNRSKTTAGNWYVCEMEVMNENTTTAFHSGEVYYCPKDGYIDVNGALFEVGTLDVFRLATKEEIPQPKQEWSEEDEKMYARIVRSYTSYEGRILYATNLSEDNRNNILEDLNEQELWLKYRLKTIRPQKQWKPSEEQMDALEDAIADAVSSIQKNMLNSLYQDLQKLR